MLVRITPGGEMLWNRTYTFLSSACGVVQTGDGGFLIVGDSDLGPGFMLLKTDAYGFPLWNVTCTISFQGSEGGYALAMIQARNGGYIVAGTAKYYNVGHGNDDAFAAEFDSGGNLQWNRTYGGNGIDIISSAISIDGAMFWPGQQHLLMQEAMIIG
jgi:hypothetical protein